MVDCQAWRQEEVVEADAQGDFLVVVRGRAVDVVVCPGEVEAQCADAWHILEGVSIPQGVVELLEIVAIAGGVGQIEDSGDAGVEAEHPNLKLALDVALGVGNHALPHVLGVIPGHERNRGSHAGLLGLHCGLGNILGRQNAGKGKNHRKKQLLHGNLLFDWGLY